MSSAPLLERLRAALAPDYTVEREIASGGMGTVFLGRDAALDRLVAIKIIRPDLATAVAAERFLREARSLASLSHPNVLPIHRAGEAGGFSYYVMDFLDTETLADRLRRGPMAPADAVRVARDVLAALAAAHEKGIVHRDVKPSNIFLLAGRAVLADFGIARSSEPDAETLTVPGLPIGSPGYMAPEQVGGHPATPATDLCAVGLVLFEALTGLRFAAWAAPGQADWSAIPRALVPVLRRALVWDPTARWPDAGAFAQALERAGAPALKRLRAGTIGVLATATVAVALAGAAIARSCAPAPPTEAREIAVLPFRVGGTRAARWLGDSLAASLVHALGANTDFHVRFGTARGTPPALTIEGQATVRGMRLAVVATRAGSGDVFRAEAAGSLDRWQAVAPALAQQILLALWSREHTALAGDLPIGAAPRTPEGLRAFLRAELLFAHAQWGAAYQAYVQAAAIDSTCLICDVRIFDVARWLGLPPEREHAQRYRAALGVFPPNYRQLIAASFAPPARRLEMLAELTTTHRGWGFGWFVRADELFHRGAFEGRRRGEALALLEHASVLRPDFAPISEHLVWVATAEGDLAVARAALARYTAAASAGDETAATIRALLGAGLRWRFTEHRDAVRFTDRLLRRPETVAWADIGAAPSYLLTFDTPRATVLLGERFAAGVPRAGLELTGLLAQSYGLAAIGRPDSAAALARRAATRSADADLALYAAELPVVLAIADSADVARRWARLAPPLEAFASSAAPANAQGRARAAWLLALLAHRAGRSAEFAEARRRLTTAERPGGPLGVMVSAVALRGERSLPAAALRESESLLALDSANRGGDPFFRAVLHLLRAEWHAAAGSTERAVRELRWHENDDWVGYPGQRPQAAEVDYALGTLARWRRARLLDTPQRVGDDEACSAYAAVVRHWRGGEGRYAARADTAAARFRALRCPGS